MRAVLQRVASASVVVDGAVVGGADVAARPRDPQRSRQLARRACRAAEQVGAVEPGALPALADVERDRLRGASDLVGQRLAALADLGLHGGELLQHGERHLERIEHRDLLL